MDASAWERARIAQRLSKRKTETRPRKRPVVRRHDTRVPGETLRDAALGQAQGPAALAPSLRELDAGPRLFGGVPLLTRLSYFPRKNGAREAWLALGGSSLADGLRLGFWRPIRQTGCRSGKPAITGDSLRRSLEIKLLPPNSGYELPTTFIRGK